MSGSGSLGTVARSGLPFVVSYTHTRGWWRRDALGRNSMEAMQADVRMACEHVEPDQIVPIHVAIRRCSGIGRRNIEAICDDLDDIARLHFDLQLQFALEFYRTVNCVDAEAASPGKFSRHDQALNALKPYLAFPSISTNPQIPRTGNPVDSDQRECPIVHGISQCAYSVESGVRAKSVTWPLAEPLGRSPAALGPSSCKMTEFQSLVTKNHSTETGSHALATGGHPPASDHRAALIGNHPRVSGIQSAITDWLFIRG